MPITRRILGRQAATSLYGRTRGEGLSYDTPGMTLVPGDVPEGFHEHTGSRVLGTGDAVFRRVGYGLMHWGVLKGAGYQIKTSHEAVNVGGRASMSVPVVWPLAVVGACEVVDVVATGRSLGFSLGTLVSHPASGEELFVLTHRDDDQVEFSVRSLSRPNKWYGRGPFARSFQGRAIKKYLQAAEQLAAEPSTDLVAAG
jgi:uncharacterized protein (UPF0548 family)